ncbi:MAG: hypothetical protein GY746_13010, partial [Gammaproteobacteria bacterium]|nr:hypothetical protein [Gammaproteobacteria bacterium]
QVEEGTDDDIIRFDMEGTEFFRMDSGRLEVVNTGHSVFIGDGAGANDDFSDNKNVAIGDSALFNNTYGHSNVATGYRALYSNTYGEYNVANGSQALFSNTTGDYNVANGFWALTFNISGEQNVATGYMALIDNTTGVGNVANGYRALWNNTTGSYNTALGYYADVSIESLTNATAIGAYAIVSQDSSLVLGNAARVGIGTSAPTDDLDVNGSIRMRSGANDGFIPVSDADGVLIWTDPASLTDTSNIITDADNDTKIQVEEGTDDDIIRFDMAGTEFFRMDKGRLEVVNTGNSVFIGAGAGANDDFSNNYNVAVGDSALFTNTTGEYNVATGYKALYSMTTGHFNVANGYHALYNNTTGTGNVANGYYALNSNTTGNFNTANGCLSLDDNTSGSFNVAIGYTCLTNNTTGYFNAAYGNYALYSNTSGIRNVASGNKALYFNTIGNYNVASGHQALYNNTTGLHNAAIGTQALETNTKGSFNTAIGYYADVYYDTLTNATAIGANAKVSQDSSLVLGNAARVGIGTSAPTDDLDVNGSIRMRAGANDGFIPVSDANGVMTWTNPSIYTAGDNLGDHTATENLKLSGNWLSNDGGSEGVFVDTDGNVGVGLNDPSQNLDVSGKIRMRTGAGVGYMPVSDVDGVMTWTDPDVGISLDKISDNDNDTKIQVEEGTDDDIIRFDMEGTEFFRMDSGRLEVVNTGLSVFIGDGAGANDDFSDNKNVAIGDSALFNNTTGDGNVANGYRALYSNTRGYYNVASGFNALYYNTTGDLNVATGSYSLYSNISGSRNVANGYKALIDNTTGVRNVANGYWALYSNTEGIGNVANGYSALSDNTTGSYNTAIGYLADVYYDTLTNATAIGAYAIVSQDSSLVLGNAANVGIGTSAPG